jgi:rhodanese-related sulfurtransferase
MEEKDMKIVLSILLTLTVLFCLTAISTAPAGAATQSTRQVQTLYVGQSIPIGSISVWNDANNLFVKYVTTAGWQMAETHLAVAIGAGGIPQTNKHNPIPGQFAYGAVHDPPVAQYTYTVPISSDWRYPITDLKIAAHAAVRLLGVDQQVLASESAWAAGTQFAGASWGTYFNNVRDLSVAEACALIHDDSDLVILDVRSAELYGTSHITGAINIPYSVAFKTSAAVNTLDNSKTYLVYCGSGNNGAKASADLRDLGFTRVYNLANGYSAWPLGGCPSP